MQRCLASDRHVDGLYEYPIDLTLRFQGGKCIKIPVDVLRQNSVVIHTIESVSECRHPNAVDGWLVRDEWDNRCVRGVLIMS